MGKLEGMIKSEIVRLAKREVRKIARPLSRDVRSMRSTVSQLRKTVLALQRLTARQESESRKEKVLLEAAPEEVKKSRFSPRLIHTLRKRLGITQKEMATLTGVTVGAIYQWEQGMFEPRGQKKGMLVALRRLGRREVRKLLEERRSAIAEKKVRRPKSKRTKRSSRK